MQIPNELREAIEQETKKYSLNQLAISAEKLSKRYRGEIEESGSFLPTEIDRLAYLLVRLPATYAAIKHVLQEAATRLIASPPISLLDLGSGPGTVLWAASQIFPVLTTYTLYESDKDWIVLGKKLIAHVRNQPIHKISWQQKDISNCSGSNAHDLIVMSYALNELSSQKVFDALRYYWDLAQQAFIIIEPGTVAGYQRIIAARDFLISLGAHIIAPCPGNVPCPLLGRDWCHFAERLERTSEHRILKGGSLGYEDEKFSYFVASKTEGRPCSGRILRHPLKHPGHISFNLCTSHGFLKKTVSKKEGSHYKTTRKLEWGECFDCQ